MSHPRTRADRRATAQRCQQRRAQRARFARRVNALLTIHRQRQQLLELLRTA